MSERKDTMRTAVLVVHGMGSQRPLQTVRGVVEAVWLDESDPGPNQRRFWLHPQLSGTDVDLSVFTTTYLSKAGGERKCRFDFHELYWAHLMSETKPVAVLLWLFELARRGPSLNPRIAALWWGGAMFLGLLILSISFLAVWIVNRQIAGLPDARALLFVPILMLAITAALITLYCLLKGAWRFAALSTGASLLLFGLVLALSNLLRQEQIEFLVASFFPATIALLATWMLMGRWGVAAYTLSYALSVVFMAILGALWTGETTHLPWSLNSPWSVVSATFIIGLYLAASAAFLVPYLGDAARYFRNSPANVRGQREIRRQAVDTLEELHLCGKYDRIIVVAHSLGTVVAYDMLRAYFSRVAKRLPTESPTSPALRRAIEAIDSVTDLDRRTLRQKGREIIQGLAELAEQNAAGKPPLEARAEHARSWLVTDFVTLGSPLTHAIYLMSSGRDEAASLEEFERNKRERQYPTCPPALRKDERRLTYEAKDRLAGQSGRRFHHGAMFGLTRWTNLYFPMAELIWGDAIGGVIAPVFGWGVVDVPVSTFEPAADALFTHVTYWDISRDGGRQAPHIQKLRRAINLEDGEAMELDPPAMAPIEEAGQATAA